MRTGSASYAEPHGCNIRRPVSIHVLLVPSWYPTPENPVRGSFFREQAQALARAGHRVGVIAPDIQRLPQHGHAGAPQPDRFEDGGVATYVPVIRDWLPRVPYGQAALWLHSGERLFREYVRERGAPDVIHAHSLLYGGVLAAHLRRRTGIPAVLTEHSSAFARSRWPVWKKGLLSIVLKAFDARVAVSPALAGLLEATFPGRGPWQTIPNLLSRRFSDPMQLASRRSHPSVFRFLTVSLINENKGHRDLLQAFATAFRADAGVELRIGGTGAQLPDLQAFARSLGVADRVTFLGMLDHEQVRQEMIAANAFVLPSHYETFGVVLIEANACGLPVVATSCGGPNAIVDETNGLLVPPGDPPSLAAAMVAVRAGERTFDPEEIRRACLARYAEGAVTARLTPLYESLLANVPKRTQ